LSDISLDFLCWGSEANFFSDPFCPVNRPPFPICCIIQPQRGFSAARPLGHQLLRRKHKQELNKPQTTMHHPFAVWQRGANTHPQVPRPTVGNSAWKLRADWMLAPHSAWHVGQSEGSARARPDAVTERKGCVKTQRLCSLSLVAVACMSRHIAQHRVCVAEAESMGLHS